MAKLDAREPNQSDSASLIRRDNYRVSIHCEVNYAYLNVARLSLSLQSLWSNLKWTVVNAA